MRNFLALKIENFRVFKNSTEFSIKPITLLTGPNNSGKSSLIKLVKLLKESVENVDRLDRLYFNKSRDLPSYKACLNDPEKSMSIGITIGILNNKFQYEIVLYYRDEDATEVVGSNAPYLYRIQLLYKEKSVFDIEFLKKESPMYHEDEIVYYRELFTYDVDISDLKCFLRDFDEEYAEQIKPRDILIFGDLVSEIKNYEEGLKKLKDLLIYILPKQKFEINGPVELDHDLKVQAVLSYFSKSILIRDDCSKDISEVIIQGLKQFIEYFFVEGLKGLEYDLSNSYFSSISSRSLSGKIISLNDTAIGRLIYEYANLDDLTKRYTQREANRQLVELEMGFHQIRIVCDEDFQVGKIDLGNKDGQQWRSLSNLGSGVTQIISIVLFISIAKAKQERKGQFGWGGPIPSIMILEEPETSLHPNLQSKLLDLIVEATHYKMRFIIETHSPYFVRRLQYYRVVKSLKEGQLALYYFNLIDESNNNVKEIKITDDGLLEPDFGEGFLDEETELKLQLMMSKSKNLN